MKQRVEVVTDLTGPRDINRDREHHYLHHADGGDNQPPHVHALFMLQTRLGLIGLVGLGVVANGGQFGQQLRELQLLGIPAHPQAVVG